jgi:CHAT domain-containing protein
MPEHTEQERGTVSAQSTVIHSRPARASLRWWVVVGLVVAAVILDLYWIAQQPSRQLRSAEALLAQAYSKQRGFDLRLPDASYAPIESQPENGERSAFSRPIALLEAESRIAVRLAKNPDDAQWLRLRARAEMLDRHYDDAVSTLQRATDAQPDDVSLLADLGCAYALRAEGERRDIDYGAAIDMLWRFLRAKPDSPVALFNRAVVYERMFLYDDARKDWEHYLKLDPSSGWAQEARGRKQAIEQKMAAREQAVKSLASASGYLESVKNDRAWDPEFYLEAAVTSWLPAAGSDAAAGEAVGLLARLLREKHGDGWLEDLLKAKHDARYREATAHLAAARKHNLAEEPEGALEEARGAQRIYRQAGIRAGEVGAKYEEVYALYRSMELKKCLPLAGQVAREAARLRYAWILGQALMEEGNCQAVGEGSGRANFERALVDMRARDYKTLQLRALGLLGGHAANRGNQVAVWQQITGRLATYWLAPYHGKRAQQFYRDLSVASVSLGYRFSAFVFRRAAAEAIAVTGNQAQEAFSRAVLASLADVAGLTAEADREFSTASKLFARCCQTGALQRQRFAAEVARAESQVKNKPEMALRRLQKMVAPGRPFPSQELDTELSFYQTEGRAKLMLGDLKGADAEFQRAIECNERRLASLSAGTDRGGPLRKSEDAYRGAVHIRLGRNTEDALKLWEWYRSADLAGSRRELDPGAPVPRLDSEIVLSYVLSPAGGLSIWILDDGAVECRRLSVRMEDLEPLVSRFLRQCADPKSAVSALQRDARQLYDWLIAPVADRLRPGRVHVIEPDGPIGAIPLQALVDPAGNYLGERFPIVVSRGLIAYQERSHLKPLTSHSAALVIANPALGSDMAKTFPPLVDAEVEARDLAALFTKARVLSGKESTLEGLESARGGIEVFHFAGHSVSSGGDAGLLLAPSGESDMGGVLLRGSRLLGQDWKQCSLAVLSACSTGTGERNGFVNPESLVRAFLNAGAGRVIASRWNVDTAATAGFMRRFYQSVLAGVLPSSALREAAEALRKDPATAHPYYWAAFQLFGYK